MFLTLLCFQVQDAGLPIVSMEQMAAQGEVAVKALQDDMQRLQMLQKQAEQNLSRVSGTLQDTLQDVDNLKAELTAAGKKYGDMQELKAYISDLCDCLKVSWLCVFSGNATGTIGKTRIERHEKSLTAFRMGLPVLLNLSNTSN